jgi:hypothetical protein
MSAAQSGHHNRPEQCPLLGLLQCPLLTQSGHCRIGLIAVQTGPEPHFAGRKSLLQLENQVAQIGPGEGNAATRFHRSNCRFSNGMALRCASASAMRITGVKSVTVL